MKITHLPRMRAIRKMHGVAAVEFALILAIFMFILPATVLFGRVFWQYNVLKHATENAARYMAHAPLGEILYAPSEDVAKAMVSQALADAGISYQPADIALVITCPPSFGCTLTTPTSIQVGVSVALFDNEFYLYTMRWLELDNRWSINVSATVRYAN